MYKNLVKINLKDTKFLYNNYNKSTKSYENL